MTTSGFAHTLRFSFCFSAVWLAACTPGQSIHTGNPQVAAPPDQVSLMLAQAADRASNALETLAAIEQARAPKVALEPIHGAPPELRRAVTVNWVGPAGQIARKMAERASYNFITLGAKPPVPVVVSLDVENMPVIEILRSIGLQMGQRATIKVDSRRRVVELHYASVTAQGGG